jgi:hypothetical protein
VRREVGLLIRTNKASDVLRPSLLTVTGLLPDSRPNTTEAADFQTGTMATQISEAAVVDEVVTQLLRHTRYLLTLKGRPPFRLAGIETYQRLQSVIALTDELLTHRLEPRLTRLRVGLCVALTPFTGEYQELRQGETWLRDIDLVLEPDNGNPSTGQQVAQRLRAYLDGLTALPDLPPRLDAFRHHLNKVSSSYWAGLFHCYDIEGLPRTNNDLESHFRDTRRRLLRTTGQKGQTRRTLQRTGAWELLPRPPTEARCFAALRQVAQDQLALERQRLRRHLQRFRLHSRSIRRVNAQFDRLRKQWLALASTSTG